MGQQEANFFQGEGDAWHNRNKDKVRDELPIVSAVLSLGVRPQKIMEIGCGYGANVGALQKNFACDADGIEPSKAAREYGAKLFPRVRFLPGGASEINSKPVYDMIIYGACLHLCDRENLSQIVGSGDRALKDGGYLVIQDFDPDYIQKVPYPHVPGMFSYKMNYAKLWEANPAYTLVAYAPHPSKTAVWVLKKDLERGWPLEASLRGEKSNG